jgi:hypothetical protein
MVPYLATETVVTMYFYERFFLPLSAEQNDNNDNRADESNVVF